MLLGSSTETNPIKTTHIDTPARGVGLQLPEMEPQSMTAPTVSPLAKALRIDAVTLIFGEVAENHVAKHMVGHDTFQVKPPTWCAWI